MNHVFFKYLLIFFCGFFVQILYKEIEKTVQGISEAPSPGHSKKPSNSPSLGTYFEETHYDWKTTENSRTPWIYNNIAPKYRDDCEKIISGKAFSLAQGYQDWIMYHNYFKNRTTPGFYLELGTNQATVVSNVLFFEECLNWSGICVEPSANYHAEILKERSCKLVKNCVSSSRKSNVVMSGLNVVSGAQRKEADSLLECVSFHQLMSQFPNQRKIDLLSVDIEKMEPEVFRCLDFDAFDIEFILIEVAHHNLFEVDTFFHRKGYSNVESFGDSISTNTESDRARGSPLDCLYRKNSVPRKYPPPSQYGKVHHDDFPNKPWNNWAIDWTNWDFRSCNKSVS